MVVIARFKGKKWMSNNQHFQMKWLNLPWLKNALLFKHTFSTYCTCRWTSAGTVVAAEVCRWMVAASESCRAQAGSWCTERCRGQRTTWRHRFPFSHQKCRFLWQRRRHPGCPGAAWAACHRRRAGLPGECFCPCLLSALCWRWRGCLRQRHTTQTEKKAEKSKVLIHRIHAFRQGMLSVSLWCYIELRLSRIGIRAMHKCFDSFCFQLKVQNLDLDEFLTFLPKLALNFVAMAGLLECRGIPPTTTTPLCL